jgi:hypothetical protein
MLLPAAYCAAAGPKSDTEFAHTSAYLRAAAAAAAAAAFGRVIPARRASGSPLGTVYRDPARQAGG